MPLPGTSLVITGLFSDTVTFPFDTLPPAARQRFGACFAP
jgi:hypothetical protein